MGSDKYIIFQYYPPPAIVFGERGVSIDRVIMGYYYCPMGDITIVAITIVFG
jgi:hypothetical protein